MVNILHKTFYAFIDNNFYDVSVNELEDMIKNEVEKYYEIINSNGYTPRYFKKIFCILGFRKKYQEYAKSFNGMDEKNVCIFFIQNYISDLLNNIECKAKIFKKEEEDKTNKKHLQQRKIVIDYINKIRKIFCIFNFSFKSNSNFNIKEKLTKNNKFKQHIK